MVHRNQQKGIQNIPIFISLNFFRIFIQTESGFRPRRLRDMGSRKMVPMDRDYRNTRMFSFRHGIHDYLLPILPSGR